MSLHLIACVAIQAGILLPTIFAAEKVSWSGKTAEVPLSPRPMVTEKSQDFLDLGGTWLHREKPEDDFSGSSVTGRADWREIRIPHPMLWIGQKSKTIGYQRTFRIPDDWVGKRIKFRCDSAEGIAEVWVKGMKIGEHEGPWAMFEMDATEAVRMGAENILSIRVRPSVFGLGCDPEVGITRKVYLMALPAINVAGLRIETTPDSLVEDRRWVGRYRAVRRNTTCPRTSP